MTKIDYEISPEIYAQPKILQAIEDFSNVSLISYQNWILTVSWENEVEIKEIFQEFMNYLLSI